MDKIDFNLQNFMTQCKSILPVYFKSLKPNSNSYHDPFVVKKIIILFLKEYYVHNNTKFFRNKFNSDFITTFLNNIIFSKSPELQDIPISKIQSIILDFINFLSLKSILIIRLRLSFLM